VSRTRFLPELDGVRALAILAVLAAHAGVAGLTGGFVGVDLFFVLSGFLITSLLLEERLRSGRIRLAAFWARRARRLLPAALVMVAAVVAARPLLPPDTVGGLRTDAFSAALWSSNWRWALGGTDYFAQGGTASPLQHTWSLAVEEQFYVCWPVLLTLLWLATGTAATVRRRVLIGAGGGAVGSALLTLVLAFTAAPGRVYFGTDTRAQELLVGAALGALLLPTWQDRARGDARRRPGRWLPTVSAAVGLLVLLAAVHLADGSPGEFRAGLMTLVVLASAALIAGLVLAPRSALARVFASRPAVALGRASYSVYLWHWPAFEVFDGERTGLARLPLLAVRLAVTAVLATASLMLVELPAQRLRLRPTRLLPAAGAAIAVVVTFAACAAPAPRPAPHLAAAGAMDAPPPLPRPSSSIAAGPRSPSPSSTPVAARRHGGPLRVDVFGDSIAWTLTHYLPALSGIEVRDHTVLGCGVVQGGPYRYFGQQYPDKPRCDRWPTTWARAVERDRPDVVLLIVGRWETMDRVYAGGWTHVGEPAFDAHLSAELDRAASVLTATGAALVLSNEPYNRRGEQPDGSLYPEDDPSRVDAWNRLVAAELRKRPDVRLLDLNNKLCPDGRFTWDVDGMQIRSDGVHFTPEGVRWLTPWLVRTLRAAAR
jgi:peptidoglycan/LPS O-acetylase OafA/YrhL